MMVRTPGPADHPTPGTGVIAWFVRNPVAANFLMATILLIGVLTTGTIRKQLLPQEPISTASITVGYPGAAAKEVEKGVALKVESALEQVQGIENVVTYSDQGKFSATLRLDPAHNPQTVLNRIRTSIDAISSLPEEAEKPHVELEVNDQEVMHLLLYGDVSERRLTELGNEIFHELQDLPSVSVVELLGKPEYEVNVEIRRDTLREYGLTFESIAQSIRQFSGNLPAGQVEGANGVVSVRVENQAYTAKDYARTPIVSLDDGTRVTLGEIAAISETFVDGIQYSTFNRKRAVSLFVRAGNRQSISEVAEDVKKYVSVRKLHLPEGVILEPWIDFTYYLEERLDLMLDNIKWSLALVFLMLLLFLQVRLAFWVTVGLPVSVLGALALMPLGIVDVTINIASLFGFVLVLGIVVDDAIVVGESIHTEVSRSGHSADSVVRGVESVALPVTVGVLTTIIAFLPLLASTGEDAPQSKAIAWVVVLCLTFSLLESKLILPSHLHQFCQPSASSSVNWVGRLRQSMARASQGFVAKVLDPMFEVLLSWRYVALAAFATMGLLCISAFMTGVVNLVGSPKIPHDYPTIEIELAGGTTPTTAGEIIRRIEDAVLQVESKVMADFGRGMVDSIYVSAQSPTTAEITVKLVSPGQRPIDPFDLSQRWHEAIPKIPGLQSFVIFDSLFSADVDIGGGGDIVVGLEGRNEAELQGAAIQLSKALRATTGLTNVNDSLQNSDLELRITLKDIAYNLGLSHAAVADQINAGFYGLEAQRLLSNGEEIRVMIRYPLDERQSLAQVRSTLVTLQGRQDIPLSQVADIEFVKAANSIRRENGRSSAAISADLVPTESGNPDRMFERIDGEIVPAVLATYPSVSVESGGRIIDEEASLERVLKMAGVCFVVIFALIAVLLRSYVQPLIVLVAIPFCFIGAVIGHFVLGMDVSSYSLFGVVAASGVCINDSLVLVDFANRTRREQNVGIRDAIAYSIRKRFRAVVLTSLTTFVGLMPILTETGLQAQIVVPMAVSLAFGVLFATMVTLMLVPCLYYVFDDFMRIGGRIDTGAHAVVS